MSEEDKPLTQEREPLTMEEANRLAFRQVDPEVLKAKAPGVWRAVEAMEAASGRFR